jgi:hypothetical protein
MSKSATQIDQLRIYLTIVKVCQHDDVDPLRGLSIKFSLMIITVFFPAKERKTCKTCGIEKMKWVLLSMPSQRLSNKQISFGVHFSVCFHFD